MSNAEHAGQIICHVVLGLIVAVNIVEEVIEDLNHCLLINFKLLVLPLGYLFGHITIDIVIGGHEVLLDSCECCVFPHLQIDDLVGYDG